jgi:hypothetical protein
MTDVIDRQERHTAAAAAWRVAKGAAVLIGYYLVVAGMVALMNVETPTLAHKIVMGSALAIGFIYPFFLAARTDILDGRIHKGLDEAFRGTTWVSCIDGKVTKGAFIGASDDLRSMKLSLANGAVRDIRIDHAMPVGHELRTPGQFSGLSRYEAGLVAAERRDVVNQLRIGAIVVGSVSVLPVLLAGPHFPWAIGPFLIAMLSSLIVFGIAEGEKDDFAQDSEFIEKFDELTAAAMSETPITAAPSDQSIQCEVARTAGSRLRHTIIIGNAFSCFGGMGMSMFGGALPYWQYAHSDLAFQLHRSSHPAVVPEHAAAWLVGGLVLITVSMAIRLGYDRKFLMPASRFNRHRWVTAGGASGKVEAVESGGSFLFLRFDDNTLGKYPIKCLRRGDLITG